MFVDVQHLLLYSDCASERLAYIGTELFESRAGVKVIYTQSYQHFVQSDMPLKLAYTAQMPETKCLHIKPHGLLFEDDIKPQQINVSQSDEWGWIFFEQAGAHLPFDILAASFFLMTRYEEYLPHQKDKHGRFDYAQSVAYIHGFLGTPIIEKWLTELCSRLETDFGATLPHTYKFRFVSTVDVDYAYLYKGIGMKRWWRKWIKSILDARPIDAIRQLLVLTGIHKDPYDTYDYIHAVASKIEKKPICFYLIGRTTAFDKNILPDSIHLKPLLKRLNKMFTLGIHPSYNSYNSHRLIQFEKQLLEQKSGVAITQSRQHYLRFSVPQTYQLLLQSGISEDYSMGYGNISGFRASTCRPFKFFNLVSNKTAPLLLHPVMLMDTTLRYAMRLTPEQAIAEAKRIIDAVKKYDGECVVIWHNSSLSKTDGWDLWREVFEKIHAEAMQN